MIVKNAHKAGRVAARRYIGPIGPLRADDAKCRACQDGTAVLVEVAQDLAARAAHRPWVYVAQVLDRCDVADLRGVEALRHRSTPCIGAPTLPERNTWLRTLGLARKRKQARIVLIVGSAAKEVILVSKTLPRSLDFGQGFVAGAQARIVLLRGSTDRLTGSGYLHAWQPGAAWRRDFWCRNG